MQLTHFLFLLLPLFIATHATPTLTHSRTPGALIDFDFIRSQCLEGRFTHSATHSLTNSSSTVASIDRVSGICLPYNGISTASLSENPSSPAGVSSEPLTHLLTALENTTQFTFTYWFIPPPELPTTHSLTSVVNFEYGVGESLCVASLSVMETSLVGSRQSASRVCECGSGQDIVLLDGITYAHTHSNTHSNTHSYPTARFVVVTFEYHEYSVPVWGTVRSVITNSSLDSELSSVVTQSNHRLSDSGSSHPSQCHSLTGAAPHLTLMSANEGSQWSGELLHLSLYPRLLTSEEIENNYHAGLANSLPLTWNLTVRVSEDVRANISLPVFDSDNQQWHTNFKLHCSLPHTLTPSLTTTTTESNTSHHVCKKMSVRLTRSPTHGSLFIQVGSDEPQQLTLGGLIEFDASGSSDSLTHSSIIVTGNSNYVVYYQPPPHAYSFTPTTIYDSFDITAVDGWTSEVSETATVSLVVEPVNDPPVALTLSLALYAKQCIILPALQGTDTVDYYTHNLTHPRTGDSWTSEHYNVQSAVIVTLPSNGTLHQVYPNMTLDSEAIVLLTPHGTELLTPFTVGYCHTGEESITTSHTSSFTGGGNVSEGVRLVGSDMFSFSVMDSMNESSLPASVTLHITPRLQSIPHSDDMPLPLLDMVNSVCVEATLCHLNIFGKVLYDTSSNTLLTQQASASECGSVNMTIRVENTPSNGTLYDLASGVELSPGDIVSNVDMKPVPHSHSHMEGYYYTTVGYLSDTNFFTQPQETWSGDMISPPPIPDSFTFTVVTVCSSEDVSSGRVVSTALPVEQLLEVRNKNNPSEITFTFQSERDAARGYFEVYAFGTTGVSDGVSDGVSTIEIRNRHRQHGSGKTLKNANNDSNVESPIKSYVIMDSSFTLTDLDRGTDIIHVRVSSANSLGLLTLNPLHVQGVDFNSETYCSSNVGVSLWTCEGDGYNDRVMSFVGTPENVSLALNGMQYVSTHKHHTDWVNITLYDGVGNSDGCFSERQFDLHKPEEYLSSYRDECFVREVSVQVRVMGYYDDSDNNDDDDNPFDAKGSYSDEMIWITRGLIASILLVCCYCLLKALCTPCMKMCNSHRQQKFKAGVELTATAGKKPHMRKKRKKKAEIIWAAAHRSQEEVDNVRHSHDNTYREESKHIDEEDENGCQKFFNECGFNVDDLIEPHGRDNHGFSFKDDCV